jgi:cytochrome c oxidase cbb3-type subunit III
MATPTKPTPVEEPLRPHSYDGIQEYDKRLPNWWLFTLYIAIAFSFVYWLYYHLTDVGKDEHAVFAREMEAVQAARLANVVDVDDATLWEMSRNSQIVAEGKKVFMTNCVSCHLASLRGKDESPTAVGPNLTDATWIHGGMPTDLRHTITTGVPDKGMPTWGPVLGDNKIIQVVAFVLSHHDVPPPGSPAAGKKP